jgi:hypothetical protein
MPFLVLLSDDVGINLSYFDYSFCGPHPLK